MNYQHVPRKVSIYKLIDPRDGRAYYVGQTFDTDARYGAHLRDWRGRSLNCRSDKRAEWLRSLHNQNIKPEMVILEVCSFDVRDYREAFWVCQLLHKGQPLTNNLGCGLPNYWEVEMSFRKPIPQSNPKRRNSFDPFQPRRLSPFTVQHSLFEGMSA